ncbi:unnamed protein product [Meloidogyne enterolobii]|uniref:Uncharacterized protein n=2 Tax=Meloidogyne enterolobii TaxID=390850 RepID=A0ACB0Z902_MELEN
MNVFSFLSKPFGGKSKNFNGKQNTKMKKRDFVTIKNVCCSTLVDLSFLDLKLFLFYVVEQFQLWFRYAFCRFLIVSIDAYRFLILFDILGNSSFWVSIFWVIRYFGYRYLGCRYFGCRYSGVESKNEFMIMFDILLPCNILIPTQPPSPPGFPPAFILDPDSTTIAKYSSRAALLTLAIIPSIGQIVLTEFSGCPLPLSICQQIIPVAFDCCMQLYSNVRQTLVDSLEEVDDNLIVENLMIE